MREMRRLLTYALMLAGVLMFCQPLLAGPAEAERKQHDVGADAPMPDDLPSPLCPQCPLTSDALTAHQSLHFIGLSTRQGIDVSHYQGQINWRQVASSDDICYVFIKATEGGSLVDNTYRTNLSGARKAGLKVGIYHFFSPSVPVRDQLQNLFANVRKQDLDLVPMIDVEQRGKLSPEQLRQRLREFLAQVERHYRVRPIIYTGQNFYNKWLSGHFSNYRYMIAKYDTEIPYLVDDAPFVMWQYSATGRVPGIRGNVDRSRFMDNFDIGDILIR